MDRVTEADYVIVGAGAAGCVLAARLSADPRATVVLLEAGGCGRDPLLAVPKGFYLTMQNPGTPPRVDPDQRDDVRPWLAARLRAARRCRYPRWGWSGMLAAFLALEDHALGACSLRGVGGPLHVSVPRSDDRVVDALLGAAHAIGLVVLTDVRVDRVSVKAGRARGVVGRRADGQAVAVRARREVILTAGAIESPLLLERSGIGDPRVLAGAGIEPLVESPRVGERLIEHRAVTLQVRLRPGLGLNGRLRTAPRQLLVGAHYLLTRRGPTATGPYDLVGQLRSVPGVERPDVQILATPMSLDRGADGLRLADHAGLMLQGYQLRPTTTSSVHVRAADPAAPPLIDSRAVESDTDRAVTGRILGRLRQLVAAGPVADLVVAEELPGPDVVTPEQVVTHARATGAGVYHAVGSCAMGPAADDVVDATLSVRGVRGLRVVDASVFPMMPSGNTAAPTMALAWRAAGLVQDAAG